MPGETVGELLIRARGGEQQALDRLFELCRNYMAIVARAQVESWLQAKVDASDLVQQTLLEAYRGFGRFQGTTEAEWIVWLRRILDHNAADFIRHYRGTEKRQVRREVPIASPAESSISRAVFEPADGGDSPSQQLLKKERELELADAISRLSADHREVIILRNLRRLPFDEVAEQMNRSRPAAQMLWMRAIQKLHELMSETSGEW